MTAVKICGITDAVDARAAIALGADALGFVFADSPRRIAPEAAGAITGMLPVFVHRVGVFVDPEADTLAETVSRARLDTVQLHGNETPAFAAQVRELGVRVIKAVRVRAGQLLPDPTDYDVDGLLLDAYSPKAVGGTGTTFDWEVAARMRQTAAIILAGGLTPDNIGQALEQVRPFGVDVSSGVEQSPGRKDHGLMRRFIGEVRRFDGAILAREAG